MNNSASNGPVLPKSRVGRWFLVVIASGVLLLFAMMIVGSKTHVERPAVDKCGPHDLDAAAVADNLLNEWKHGQPGADAWEPSYRDVPAFDVRNWNRLNVIYPPGEEAATLTGPLKGTGVANTRFVDPNSSHWTYRITNANGATRAWNVRVAQSEDICKVYDITEAK